MIVFCMFEFCFFTFNKISELPGLNSAHNNEKPYNLNKKIGFIFGCFDHLFHLFLGLIPNNG